MALQQQTLFWFFSPQIFNNYSIHSPLTPDPVSHALLSYIPDLQLMLEYQVHMKELFIYCGTM